MPAAAGHLDTNSDSPAHNMSRFSIAMPHRSKEVHRICSLSRFLLLCFWEFTDLGQSAWLAAGFDPIVAQALAPYICSEGSGSVGAILESQSLGRVFKS